MKKVILLFLGVGILAAIFLTVSSFSSKAPDNVHFVRLPGANFVASGDITGTGKWYMTPTFTGKAFHCVNTIQFKTGPHEGSEMIMKSNCNTVTMEGVWHVVSGTGHFANARGNGSLTMIPERFDGTIDFDY